MWIPCYPDGSITNGDSAQIKALSALAMEPFLHLALSEFGSVKLT